MLNGGSIESYERHHHFGQLQYCEAVKATGHLETLKYLMNGGCILDQWVTEQTNLDRHLCAIFTLTSFLALVFSMKFSKNPARSVWQDSPYSWCPFLTIFHPLTPPHSALWLWITCCLQCIQSWALSLSPIISLDTYCNSHEKSLP